METKVKSKKQKNIKLIGDGSYGCVYYPGITCSGNVNNKKYVTKIQVYNRASKNEIELGEYIIKNIKNYNEYFSPIIKNCIIKLKK